MTDSQAVPADPKHHGLPEQSKHKTRLAWSKEMRHNMGMRMSFRKSIKAELRRRGWSAYRLAKEAGLPIRGVQVFLAGQCEMTTDRLAAVCEVLGLELTRKRGKRGR